MISQNSRKCIKLYNKPGVFSEDSKQGFCQNFNEIDFATTGLLEALINSLLN